MNYPAGKIAVKLDFIRAAARCGQRSRHWWIFCVQSALVHPRKPRNEPKRDRDCEWITAA